MARRAEIESARPAAPAVNSSRRVMPIVYSERILLYWREHTMSDSSSRRSFLAAGLAGPALLKPLDPLPFADEPKLDHRVLGKTGLKVTTMGFGCMITSDGSVIERAADLGVN